MQVADNSSRDERMTILLIAEDKDVHPYLKHRLRKDGYRVLVAVDSEDVFEWVGRGYIHADLVLLDLIGKTIEEALSIGREVRQHAQYDGHTPLIVMAEKYGKDVEGTDVNVGDNDWVHYLGEDPDQLQNLLYHVMNRAGDNGRQHKIA